jgi:gamma-glutamylcyclotransferase (GGCT)/AIG2-like uncharacterized protein YtfP
VTRPLFLYGTLLDPRVLARQAGSRLLARGLVRAWLRGWRRVGLRGTPYPTLVPDAAALTDGAVLRPELAALRRLRAYEGPGYRLVPVRPVTPRGRIVARAWIAHGVGRAEPGRDWPVPARATAAPPALKKGTSHAAATATRRTRHARGGGGYAGPAARP